MQFRTHPLLKLIELLLLVVVQPELACANAFAGSLLSLLRWWMDHSEREPAAKMDKMFHRMVWNGLR